MLSVPSLTKDRLQELRDAAVFIPQPGKQMDAWSTEAQLIGYGGSAGSGKSAIGCGYALQRHQRSLIVRREAAQLVAITDFLTQCIGTTEGLNRQSGVWQLPGDRQIRFGGCPPSAMSCAMPGLPVTFFSSMRPASSKKSRFCG